MIEIKVEEKYEEQTITGYIDNHKVIVLYVKSKQVGMSTTLPARINNAKVYMTCYNEVFAKYNELTEKE